MSRTSRNSVLFDADTIARKPAWLQRQIAALTDTGAAVRPEVAPTHTKVAPKKQKPSNGTPAPLAPRSKDTKPQPAALRPPDDRPRREAAYTGRVLVRVTSYRCGRLCDADNLAVKFAVDCLRFAGLIRDDTPEAIELQVRQQRVPTRKEEGTEILIEPLP